MSKFEVVRGVEGCCLALDDTRIAGPKPWGGGTVIHAWETDKEYKAVDAHTAELEAENTKLRELAKEMYYVISENNSWWDFRCDETKAFHQQLQELGIEVDG